MHYDLIIIGMGLSGLMAAKTAAEAGKRSSSSEKGWALSTSSPIRSMYWEASRRTKAGDGLSQWIKDHPKHPYSKMGPEKIEEALSSFLLSLSTSLFFSIDGRRKLSYPNRCGNISTHLSHSNHHDCEEPLSKKGIGLIVGFKGFKDFYAHYVADQLQVSRSYPLSS